MNNQLLQQLANKLGTTVDYLWQVLLDQAVINGIINLVIYALTIISIVIFTKYHKKYSRPNKNGDVPYNHNDVLQMTMFLLGMTIAVGTIFCLLTIPDTIISFLSPEYWALNEILRTIGGK